MSRIACVMAGLVVLSLTLISPVLADTIGAPTDLDYARGSDAAGNYVELDRDNLSGTVHLLLSTTTHQDIECVDGSFGSLDIHFYGVGTPTTYTFGRRQSDASAAGYVHGSEQTSNTCEGINATVAVTHQVEFSIVGSRTHTTTSWRRRSPNPDGTTTMTTFKSTVVVASGQLAIDSVSTSADGAIGHIVVSERTH